MGQGGCRGTALHLGAFGGEGEETARGQKGRKQANIKKKQKSSDMGAISNLQRGKQLEQGRNMNQLPRAVHNTMKITLIRVNKVDHLTWGKEQTRHALGW